MISRHMGIDDRSKTREDLIVELNELRERLSRHEQEIIRPSGDKETNYKELIQSANSIFLEIDDKGDIIFVNEYAMSFFGYRKEDIIGKNIVGTIVPATDKSGKDLSSMIDDLLAHPDSYIINENENIRHNGERAWIAWTNRPIMDENGKLIKILSVGNDITRRKLAEEALQYERLQLLSIFDSIDEVIYVTDTYTNEIIYANKAMKEKFGKSLIGGICYREIQDKVSKCDFCTNPIILKEKGKPYRWEFHNPTVNMDFLIVDRIIKWPDGRDVRFELAIDITQRKRAENSLNDAKTRAELYIDLMSHDINNINHAMLGYLEIAQEFIDLKDGERELISKPIELINNISKLIDNLKKLQVARSDRVSHYSIDIGETIEKVINRHSFNNDREVIINFTPVKDCITNANELLDDILSNLIENSIKHSSGTITINIDLLKVIDETNSHYRIMIEDTGPGMPDELKKNVFQITSQDGVRLSRRGLGLRLVKALVESYSGSVSVEDRIAGDHTKGCRFIITLPASGND